MPGARLKRRVTEALTARAVAQLGEDATALDYGVDWIGSGKSIQQLADTLAGEFGVSVSRPLVSAILNNAAPDAPDRLDAARRESAYAMVEAATQIADTCESTAGGAAKARLQVSHRSWLAERFNRAAFGQGPSTNVQISFGSLMLDALRRPIAELSIPDVPALVSGEVAPAYGETIPE
jgi:hypothetical protein